MKRLTKFLFVFLAGFFSLVYFSKTALAGFGITPPYVRNESLTRNSIYEQKITLVRGNPDKDLKVNVIIDVPEANGWFSIDKGESFILPKGESKFPILIKVKVPDKAKFGQYKGRIILKTSPLNGKISGSVGIVLGAQIDVDLKVLDKKIFNFKVLGIRLFDLEEGHKFLWMFIPGKIKFAMTIKNLGNVKAKPTKVHFDVYDSSGKKLLESIDARKIKGEVKPFETKDIIAEIPTKLPSGSYNAFFKIYKNQQIVKEGNLHLSILPYGSIEGYNSGYGLDGLSLKDKLVLVLIVILILSLASFGFYLINLFLKKKQMQQNES